MKPNVKVSILCTTYNQEAYIAEALDSFLNQKTSFNYEILVNDDASTDSTPLILKKYETAHPDKIRVFYQEKNLFSQGININKAVLFPESKGDYIALCEGDDFWTSDHKLQKQFDYMVEHPEIKFCVHASINVSENGKKKISTNRPYAKDQIVPKSDLLSKVHCFATNSYFIKKETYYSYSESEIFPLKAHGDHKMSVYFSLVSPVYYFEEPMSAYRVLAKGSINESILLSKNREQVENNLMNNRIELLETANRFSNYQYDQLFREGKKEIEYFFYRQFPSHYYKITKRYKAEFKQESLRFRISSFAQYYLPNCYNALTKLYLLVKRN